MNWRVDVALRYLHGESAPVIGERDPERIVAECRRQRRANESPCDGMEYDDPCEEATKKIVLEELDRMRKEGLISGYELLMGDGQVTYDFRNFERVRVSHTGKVAFSGH
ncbi:MAG: hypothetical protein OXF02_02595 [Simkaniaceae bacterium]|nr:hypothetical protein [Simkaniaceae bacterium]